MFAQEVVPVQNFHKFQFYRLHKRRRLLHHIINFKAVSVKQAGVTKVSNADKKHEHELFDQVLIKVKSGRGGNGEIVHPKSGKMVKNFKYKPGGRLAKKIFLPVGEPANGEDGGDVVVQVDPGCGDLLHLHKRKEYAARNGANGNPAEGSCGPRSRKPSKKKASALKILVPPGVVVKKKRGGKLLGELTQVGEILIVAKGGRGGPGFKVPSHEQNEKTKRKGDIEVFDVGTDDWKSVVQGEEGQELEIQLTLRIVADVGIVGLPNAGKSSLLSVMTGATPDIAPYPFTTLMPNLGVMQPLKQQQNEWEENSYFEEDNKGPQHFSQVCADLPGLIEGAHMGKGLGRMFLRHLSRVRVLLHVVDASCEDPARDFSTVREELRMYNPQYCQRPYVVALNKMDLPDAYELREEIETEVRLASEQFQQQYPEQSRMPDAIVFTSAANGEGIERLCKELDTAVTQITKNLEGNVQEDVFDWDTSLPETDELFSSS